jgi:hypothetical protein
MPGNIRDDPAGNLPQMTWRTQGTVNSFLGILGDLCGEKILKAIFIQNPWAEGWRKISQSA